MIIRLVNEKNLVKATEVKLIKTSDYQDTLTFKLPIDEEIAVDELIGVRTKVMKQDYRVKEIITKDKYRDVYCEHKFFDCKNIVIPYVDEANRSDISYNNFENYTNLQLIVGHLNRIMRTKGDTEYTFSTEVNRSGVIECDDTPLYDLIFGEKGILKTFKVELVYDNYRVKFVEKRPSKNTEILFHEKKNISELQATVDFKEIVTKLHVTCRYTHKTTEEEKEEKERAKAAKRLEKFNANQEKIRQREEKQAQERALKRKKEEEEYKANRKKPKRTKAQIHAEHVQRQQEREKQILTNNETRRAERERKFNEREQQRAAQRVTKKKEKEKIILKTVYTSPLVDHYARPYEASLSFDSKEINTEEALIAWCNANIFTEEDPRDIPISNFSFKPTLDNYNVDINDRAMVNFETLDTNKVVHCCKIEYDALHDKYISIEFGELNKSSMKEVIGTLNAKISEANSNIARTYDILDKDFEDYVQKELEAYTELYNIDKGEIEDTINQGFEDAKIEAEKVYGAINTEIEEQLAPIREEVRNTVETYNQQLQATRQVMERNKLDSIEQLRELTSRVNNMQDLSSNPTVVELKQLASELKENDKLIKTQVTEIAGNVTREISAVKSKTQNDLNVVKAEFTEGVDGLTRKVSSLEEYKNKDGSRTETLKRWVQQDTASQLSRERTEITKIVDSKGFVKNTEFSNKFNENARGITSQLSALETYKNQDGSRVSALKQWTQENTANQLTTARRSIESWVDSKGYATTAVVNNKVRETADSFSREISNTTNSINALNSWKQTANQTLNTVTSTLNDTVKHSQLQITADSINFGSNKVFNGRNLASMLSVSPDSIKAITDRLIITPTNENLVREQYRGNVTFDRRDFYLNKISDNNKPGDEYYFTVEARQVRTTNGYKDLNAMVHVKYKDGSDDWLSTVLYPASGYGVRNCTATIKIPDRNKEIEFIEPMLQQNTWSNYTTYSINKLTVVKKKSAELIVDGSIEGKHIKAATMETGHFKAGSVTAEIIAANAVQARHLLVDDGLIQNLVSHNAFINKLWAQRAFINSLQAVKIKSTQIEADLLSAYTGRIGSFSIGNHWAGGGRWITGVNQFQIGMSDGTNGVEGAALWVNWGNAWNKVGDNAWYVMNNGKMICKNTATFNKQILAPGGIDVNQNNVAGYATTGRKGRTYTIWWSEIDQVRSQVSDERLKTNIKPTQINALDTLNSIKIVEFNWRKDGKFEKIGAIAQQVQSVDENLVVKHTIDKDTETDYLRINYYDTIPYLIKAVQELTQQNKDLKNKMEALING